MTSFLLINVNAFLPIHSIAFFEGLRVDKPDLHLMGVLDENGARPIIECQTESVVSISAGGCIVQNLDLRQPVILLRVCIARE